MSESCAICGEGVYTSIAAAWNCWFNKTAHWDCVERQPQDLWNESYLAQMRAYDMPRRCQHCGKVIVLWSALRRVYGVDIHDRCFEMYADGHRWAGMEKDWHYWKRVLKVRAPLDQLDRELELERMAEVLDAVCRDQKNEKGVEALLYVMGNRIDLDKS